MPFKPNQAPSIPGLTLLGFEVWMFTQLMTTPHRERIRLSKVLDQWTINDAMPNVIPRQCFPQSEDRAIYAGWWQAVREKYLEDPLDDSDRQVPLSLPEPPEKGDRTPPSCAAKEWDTWAGVHFGGEQASPPAW